MKETLEMINEAKRFAYRVRYLIANTSDYSDDGTKKELENVIKDADSLIDYLKLASSFAEDAIERVDNFLPILKDLLDKKDGVEELKECIEEILKTTVDNSPSRFTVIEWHDFKKEKPKHDDGRYLVRTSDCNVAQQCHWWKGYFYCYDQCVSNSKVLSWAERPTFGNGEAKTIDEEVKNGHSD